MHKFLRIALSVTLLTCAFACKRESPTSPATAEQCQPGCARLVKLKMAEGQKGRDVNVHEAGERVERSEDVAARDIKELRAELAAGGPIWDEAAAKKLPPKQRELAYAQHEYDAKQLKQMRELGIKQSEAGLAEAKQAFEQVKADAAEWQKKTFAELNGACMEGCLKKTAGYAACLTKVQAIEDAEICSRPQ